MATKVGACVCKPGWTAESGPLGALQHSATCMPAESQSWLICLVSSIFFSWFLGFFLCAFFFFFSPFYEKMLFCCGAWKRSSKQRLIKKRSTWKWEKKKLHIKCKSQTVQPTETEWRTPTFGATWASWQWSVQRVSI